MRILHIVRQFHPSVGGMEAVVRALATEQRRAGIDAQVITLDRSLRGDTRQRWPMSDTVDGVSVHRLPFVGSARYPVAPKVLGRISDGDLLHVHGVDFFADYLAAMQPLHRRKMVLSTHGGYFHTDFLRRLKSIYFGTVTRTSLSRFAAVIASSQGDAERFEKVAHGKVHLIENGVDTRKFADAASPERCPNLLTIGRLSTNKRLDRLLDAIAVAVRTQPRIVLRIVGNDFDRLRPELEARCANLGIGGNVQFLSGLGDRDVRREISKCSYFVSASEYEGFGIALVEAMSAGLVPLVSDIRSFREIVAASRVGQIIDYSNAEAAGASLARAVGPQSNDESLRSRAIQAAEAWSWENKSHKFTAVYERVLGRRKRYILGVDIASFSPTEAVGEIDRAVAGRQLLKVAFANAHTLNEAHKSPLFREVMKKSLVLNDGVGVDIASYMKFGNAFPANLNGTDFIPTLLDGSAHRLRIYLIGGRRHVVEVAAHQMSLRWPRHEVVGTTDGYFDWRDAGAICWRIRQSRADIVLVALGNPKQEIWISENAARTGASVVMGVGALFDFLSGAMPRAPLRMRRARLEWCYRLWLEPRRLAGRYVVGNALFLVRAWRDRRRHEFSSLAGPRD